MLFRKKKEVFGGDIPPDCAYCRFNSGEDEVICSRKMKKGKCRKYEYDPTKRSPKTLPSLQKYTKDDFSLT